MKLSDKLCVDLMAEAVIITAEDVHGKSGDKGLHNYIEAISILGVLFKVGVDTQLLLNRLIAVKEEFKDVYPTRETREKGEFSMSERIKQTIEELNAAEALSKAKAKKSDDCDCEGCTRRRKAGISTGHFESLIKDALHRK